MMTNEAIQFINKKIAQMLIRIIVFAAQEVLTKRMQNLKSPIEYFKEDVTLEMRKVTNLRDFAKQLPLKAYELKRIDNLDMDNEVFIYNILEWWVSKDKFASITTVIDALKNINNEDLADEIEQKYYSKFLFQLY